MTNPTIKASPTLPVDPKERERVIADFGPMIRHIAQRLAFRLPPYLDVDDLIHAGVIGLMDAMDKYDPSRKAQFKTYAEFRIRGAMLDEIRSLDWVPRSVREKMGQLRDILAKLEQQVGRPATEEEIAAALNVGVEECRALMSDARGIALVSLDDVSMPEGEPHRLLETLIDGQAEDPLLSLLGEEMRSRLVRGIARLPEKERLVISLYYQDELTMKEIGRVLGITESRVCQLHSQAVIRLKARLQGDAKA